MLNSKLRPHQLAFILLEGATRTARGESRSSLSSRYEFGEPQSPPFWHDVTTGVGVAQTLVEKPTTVWLDLRPLL